MRRTGKTTRAVDEAIQMLFKYGDIIVPNNHSMRENLHELGVDREKTYLAIDPDWKESPMVQRELFAKIVRRLNVEHLNSPLNITEGMMRIQIRKDGE